MTMMLARTTQVHRGRDGFVAECMCCDLALLQIEGFDPDVALGTLFHHHPAAPGAMHRPEVPAGWRAAAALPAAA